MTTFEEKENTNLNKAEVNELIQLKSAIVNGNLDELKKVLSTTKFRGISINKQLSYAFTSYFKESTIERKKIILLLLSQEGVEVDYLFENPTQKNEKITIFFLAALKADVFLIKELAMKFNPNINFIDCYSKNALMHLLKTYKIKKDDDDEIKLNKTSSTTSTGRELINLKNSSYSQLYSTVELLVKNGIYINSEDNLKNTALTLATEKDYFEICELLLNNGANINQQVTGNLNRTVVHMAVIQKNISLIKLFIKFKPNLLLRNSNNKNPIEEAIENTSNSEIYSILAEESNKRSDNLNNEDTKNKKELNKVLGNSNRHTPVTNKINNNYTSITQNDLFSKMNQLSFGNKPKSDVNSEPVDIKLFTGAQKFLYEKVNFLPLKDAKYSKIKSIIDNNVTKLPNQTPSNNKLIEKTEKSYANLIKKLEAQISELKKENSFLKIKNQMIFNELKVKDAILVENGLLPENLKLNNNDEKQIEDAKLLKEFLNTTQSTSISKLNNQNLYGKQGSTNINSLNFSPFTPNNIPSFQQTHKYYEYYVNMSMCNNIVPKKDILEKKFNTKMYSNDYVLKSLHKDLLDFQEYNRDEIRRIKPHQEELLGYIKEAVEEILPDYEVKLYGSHATGLCLSWSDLDTVLVHKKGMSHHQTYSSCLQSLYLKLLDKPWKKTIKFIETAHIPLIKILAADKYNNMQIDISVQDGRHYGLKCVELVKKYIKEFEALEPLLYSLKNLLKNANLNDPYTGGLSSYGLILMLVSFLQNQTEHNKSISITKDSNVGRLFLEFCYYYGVVFDHSKYVINAEPINGSDNYQEKENINNINVS